jgi:hypothetical protein
MKDEFARMVSPLSGQLMKCEYGEGLTANRLSYEDTFDINPGRC